VHTQNKDTE